MESFIFVGEAPHELSEDEAMTVKNPITMAKLREGFVKLIKQYGSIAVTQQDISLYKPKNLRDFETGEPVGFREKILGEDKIHRLIVDIEQVAQPAPPSPPPSAGPTPTKRKRKVNVKRKKKKPCSVLLTAPRVSLVTDDSDDGFISKQFSLFYYLANTALMRK